MPYYQVVLAAQSKEHDIVIVERHSDAVVALGDRLLWDGTEYRVFNIVHDLERNTSKLFVMR